MEEKASFTIPIQEHLTNTSSGARIINSVSRWLNYLGAIPMIIFGIVGAILTIFVFTKKPSFRRNPTITYLLAGAIMTAIHLPSIYLQSILVDGFGLGVFNTNDIACQEHNYLLYVTTVAAISFPCWAAFDQYVSTSREAAFRQRWSSMRLVRYAIVGTVIFWSIVYLPMIFYSGVVNHACVLTSVSYRIFNNYFQTPLVFTVAPIVSIVFFARRTIRHLHCITLVNCRDRLTRQIRRMIIPQLIILGISGIPFGLQNIYFDLTIDVHKTDLRQAIEHLFVQIIRLFYHCNFVCTFYIYLYMSSEVRKIFRGITAKTISTVMEKSVESPTSDSIPLQTLITENTNYS